MKQQRPPLLTILLATVLICAGPATAQTFKGKLGPSAIKSVYKVPLKSGRIYNISMTSTNGLDTLLRIFDATGKKVAENDDIGLGNLNSRLVFFPGKSAAYQVVATSFMGDGVGSYTLQITPFLKIGKTTVSKGKLDAKSPIFKQKIRYQGFKVQMKAGTGYLISADSKSLNVVLGVRRPGEKMLQFDDDGGKGTNARMIFSPKKTGEYEILVAPRNANGRGSFVFSIQALRPVVESADK